MRLYTEEGWLDIPHIAGICDRNNINFVVIIGKRQVGKTFGVLSYLLDYGKKFIFLRTTKTEYEVITGGANSPFEKLPAYAGRITFKREGEYSSLINMSCISPDGEEYIVEVGKAAALSTFGRIRGINGDPYTDILHDEFIPENHLLTFKGVGEAFLSMHDTVNGNRELEGRPCIRSWLLANSNNINNPIIDALGISKTIERMSLRDIEYIMDKDRGFLILMPDSSKIAAKRAGGGLYKMIGTDNKYAKMSLGNEFSQNDFTDVRSLPIQEYNPFVSIGKITLHLHKNNKTVYVTSRVKAKAKYEFTDSQSDINKFNRNFGDFRPCFMSGRMIFQEHRLKSYFTDLIGL